MYHSYCRYFRFTTTFRQLSCLLREASHMYRAFITAKDGVHSFLLNNIREESGAGEVLARSCSCTQTTLSKRFGASSGSQQNTHTGVTTKVFFPAHICDMQPFPEGKRNFLVFRLAPLPLPPLCAFEVGSCQCLETRGGCVGHLFPLSLSAPWR